MRVSVIIPAFNEAAHIADCIQSAWRAGADEVIVADGGSVDETLRLAAESGAATLVAPRGRAAQQNAGANQAKGDVLLFLHADNRLSGSAVQQLRERLGRSPATVGAFRQRIDHRGALYRLLEWGNACRARYLGLPYGDQGIFLRSDTFQELGGFPELPLMEDLALMRRCRRRNRPVLLPGPIVVSSRRWQQHGIVRQTLRNWSLLTAYALGVSPRRLARFYG